MACLTELQVSRYFRSRITRPTVTTTAVQVLDPSPFRVSLMVDPGPNAAFSMDFGQIAVSDAAFRLNSNQKVPIIWHIRDHGDLVTKFVSVIKSAGSGTVWVLEVVATEELLTLSEDKIRSIVFGQGN